MSTKTWTDEQEIELTELYMSGTDNVEDLAIRFDRNYRSVISKLVQLKIYKKPVVEKPDKELTVKAMIKHLEKTLDIELDGVNINKKENLTNIVKGLNRLLNDSK